MNSKGLFLSSHKIVLLVLQFYNKKQVVKNFSYLQERK